MKKISMLLICGLCFATGFGDEITTNNLSTQSNSGSSLATSTATVKLKCLSLVIMLHQWQ